MVPDVFVGVGESVDRVEDTVQSSFWRDTIDQPHSEGVVFVSGLPVYQADQHHNVHYEEDGDEDKDYDGGYLPSEDFGEELLLKQVLLGTTRVL